MKKLPPALALALAVLLAGCTGLLNRREKRPDPALPELTVPADFRITNAPPPIF